MFSLYRVQLRLAAVVALASFLLDNLFARLIIMTNGDTVSSRYFVIFSYHRVVTLDNLVDSCIACYDHVEKQ
jgi:hypothetical protein